jgi:hypothetical protein
MMMALLVPLAGCGVRTCDASNCTGCCSANGGYRTDVNKTLNVIFKRQVYYVSRAIYIDFVKCLFIAVTKRYFGGGMNNRIHALHGFVE